MNNEFEVNAMESAETIRREERARRAAVMGKWMWLLFWVVLVSVGANLVATLLELKWLENTVDVVSKLAYAAILLQMAGEDGAYKKAALYTAATVVVLKLVGLLPQETLGQSVVFLVASLVPLALAVYASYLEYYAHGRMIDMNSALSKSWRQLWKLEVVSAGLTIGGAVLAAVAVMLGALVMLGGSMFTIVTGVMKITYLYRSAQLFRKIKAMA